MEIISLSLLCTAQVSLLLPHSQPLVRSLVCNVAQPCCKWSEIRQWMQRNAGNVKLDWLIFLLIFWWCTLWVASFKFQNSNLHHLMKVGFPNSWLLDEARGIKESLRKTWPPVICHWQSVWRSHMYSFHKVKISLYNIFDKKRQQKTKITTEVQKCNSITFNMAAFL